jgi:endonuclease/exonuclease/phosphatase family metal-dependent hydrolase
MNSVRVLSFNIRCEYGGDGLNGWEYRKAQVLDLLRTIDADCIGLQEVTPMQASDLFSTLTGYTVLNIGRDDGVVGEATTILVKEDRFDLVKKGFFWCSETPEKEGSIGWDAVFPRIVVYVILKDKHTRQELCFINTHFDHVGKTARRESSRLLIQKAQEIAQGIPIVVVGDFNARPRTKTVRLFEENGYAEARKTFVAKKGRPKVSYHAFAYDPNRNDEPYMEWIDYIFTKGMKTIAFEVVATAVDGRYPSDHFPLIATLRTNE